MPELVNQARKQSAWLIPACEDMAYPDSTPRNSQRA
jgi:hypothetical protein